MFEIENKFLEHKYTSETKFNCQMNEIPVKQIRIFWKYSGYILSSESWYNIKIIVCKNHVLSYKKFARKYKDKIRYKTTEYYW